ncbi:MAG: hypothetical protein QOE30_2141 [Mycobacterium sp.]|nr:hypothetical protein [Mycobacterium sp.]
MARSCRRRLVLWALSLWPRCSLCRAASLRQSCLRCSQLCPYARLHFGAISAEVATWGGVPRHYPHPPPRVRRKPVEPRHLPPKREFHRLGPARTGSHPHQATGEDAPLPGRCALGGFGSRVRLAPRSCHRMVPAPHGLCRRPGAVMSRSDSRDRSSAQLPRLRHAAMV